MTTVAASTIIVVVVVSWRVGHTTLRTSVLDSFANAIKVLPFKVVEAIKPEIPTAATAIRAIYRTDSSGKKWLAATTPPNKPNITNHFNMSTGLELFSVFSLILNPNSLASYVVT